MGLESPHPIPDMISPLEPAYEDIRQETQEFLERELLPRVDDIRHSGLMPSSLIGALGASGLFGIMIPRRFGGRGLDCLARLVSVETLARAYPDAGAMLQIAQLGAMSILEFGTQAQKKRWLPDLATGERICTIAVTEELSGSHVKACHATYEERGDRLLLNGEKWFVGNAPIANLHVVFARDKHTGSFSTVLVEQERDGVDNSDRHRTLGLPAFPFGRLKLSEVEVPRSNFLGRPGQGQEIIHRVIGRHGRISVTGLALGIHQRVFDSAMKFANARQLYGDSLSALPDIRTKIFEIYRRLEICRSLAYSAATLESTGRRSGRVLALAKYVNSDYACKSAATASELFGARANLAEFGAAQLTLDAYMTQSPSGTGDVLRRRILEDLLGERVVGWDADAPHAHPLLEQELSMRG